MGIANAIGKFILMEEEQVLGFKRRTPKILVEMEVLDVCPKTWRCSGKGEPSY